VSACGNFGLVGFERHTSVVMWNMQSGIKRREFKLPVADGIIVGGAASRRARHVTGIETDALNTVVVIATLSGELHVSVDLIRC
jgi:U3 small nucleolar RNA-associated protein 21